MLHEVIRSHVLPFNSLVVQSYPQMKFSLMDQLYEYEFTLFLTNALLDVMQTHLHSCAGPTSSQVWLLTHLSTLSFCLSLTHFLITLCIHLGIPHPMIAHISRCECGHTIDALGIHLLHCACRNERTTTHDTLQNIVAIVTLKSGPHIQKEVSHFSPHHTKN